MIDGIRSASIVAALVCSLAVSAGAQSAPVVAEGQPAATTPRGIYSTAVAQARRAVVGVRGSDRGAGVVISADGLILTARRVVDPERMEKGDPLEVILSSGRVEEAVVVGTDALSGLTLLRIPGKKLPHLEIAGGLPEPLPGERIMTLSNATNSIFADLQVSCSVGTVHGVVQRGSADDYTGPILELEALSLNRHTTGGAVIDMAGRLRGMLLGPNRMRQGIFLGQAIPVSQIATAVDRIQSGATAAKTAPAFLGGNFAPPAPAGVVVTEVPFDTPLGRAGMKVGDVILAIDGEALWSRKDLEEVMLGVEPGTKLTLLVRRLGSFVSVEVETGALEAPGSIGVKAWEDDSKPGLVVKTTKGRSRNGLRKNDRVLSINGFKISDLDDLELLGGIMYPGARLEIELVRGSETRTTRVRVGKPDPAASVDDAEDGGEEEEEKEEDR